MNILKLLFPLFFILCLQTLNAKDYQPLSAEYHLAGKIAYGDIEQGKSHLYIRITGKDAKTLFNSLDVKTQKDNCTGLDKKQLDNFVCYLADSSESTYCIFAINLKENTLELGEIC